MGKYKILVLFQVWMISVASGQSGTFNMAKSLPYPRSNFEHFIVVEDTLIGYGTCFNNDTEWKQGVFVAKLDSSGNILKHNFILDAQGDLLATDKAWGNIIHTADGGYAAIAATVGRKSAFLIKLDHELQVEFIKEYPDTVNLSNYFYKLLETPEGYLLYGAIQRPDFHNDGFIRHVDKQGETVWLKNFEFSQFSTTVVNIQKRTDSTYIASFVSSTSIQENIGFSAFMVFDINGDESAFWQFPVESVVGLNRKIIVTNEGEILAYGIFKVGIIGSTPQYQSTLLGFDDQLTPVWVSHFGRIGSLNASVLLWDFAPTIDGHFIGAGETLVKDGNDPTRRVGWLYKFSTEGDSIWERKVNAPFLPLYFTNSGFFTGVGVLSSGNIIAGGTTNEGNTQYAWLVKVTNDGCLDTLFCQPVSAIETPAAVAPGLDVFPNPSSTAATLVSDIPLEGAQVLLLDGLGRMRVASTGAVAGNMLRLDTESLPSGIYTVVVRHKQGTLTGKLAVQH